MTQNNDFNNIFDNDIDSRMAKAIHEDRKKRKERDRRRKKRATRRKVALALLALVAAFCLCIGLARILHSDVFENEEEFREFADHAFESDSVCPQTETDAREYYFNDGTSYAIRRGDWVNGDIKSYLDKKSEAIIKKETKGGKDAPMAVLIDDAAYESENGTISTVVHYSTYVADGRHMKIRDAHVETNLFDGESGKGISTLQTLNVNYKTKAQEYAEEYFSKTYNKKELSDDWERFVTSDDSNFNKFVITKDQISFFFDDGTVLREGEGTPSMDVPNKIIGTTIRPAVLERYIDKKKPMVALTYDDGPYSKTENEILDTLSENGCVATFFYLGNRVKDDHKSAVRAVKIGCELGNHSWSHPVLSQLETKEIVSEITKTNAVIYKYCGVEPVIARAPYGEFNDKVLKRTGMAQIAWSLDTEDWKTRDAETTFKRIKNTKNLDGKIILMHSIYEPSAEATELIVPWLKEHGYQTVTVSELIKYRTGKPPQAGKVYKKIK